MLSIFLLLLLPLTLTAAQPNPYLFNATTLEKIGTADPAKTIFLFDLHKVVLKNDTQERIKQIWNLPNKGSLAYLMINPWFIRDVYTMYKDNHRCYEAYIEQLTEKYPALKPHKLQLLDIGNTHDPYEEVVEILKHLKKKGFRLFIFSNIGLQTYQVLQKQMPDLFALFEGAQVCSPANKYASKPSKIAYLEALNMLRNHGINTSTTQIIFIDDKKINLPPAQEVGIHALWFNTPYQLRRELLKIEAL